MPSAHPKDVKTKNDIQKIASTYGIEVVGYLKLDKNVIIPHGELGLLKGVKWEDTEVDMTGVKNPLDIMPSARAMVILGKRLLDDTRDFYYEFSPEYMASAEMVILDLAATKTMERLRENGHSAMEYTSYYLKAWAVLAGLGWIGRSRLFVSSEHGPRLRLRGILTDADLGETHEVLSDDNCGQCMECASACPVGAIGESEIDRKKCGACPLNHRRITDNAYAYCTACTASCPVGMKGDDKNKNKRKGSGKAEVTSHMHMHQAVSKQRLTP